MLSIKSNTLFPATAIVTLSIVALSVLSQYLIGVSLNEMKSDARLIHVAENQRILSHQIVNELAADNLGGILAAIPVDTLAAQFVYFHKVLKTGDDMLGVPRLAQKFLFQYRQMDASFNRFYMQIAFIAAADNTNTGVIELLDRQAEYLKKMDVFIKALNGNADMKIATFQRNEILIMLCSLAIIGLEVIFILFPAIRKIKRQNRQLRAIAFNQSHIIRQPLANIKSLINLINITTDEKEKYQFLQHVISEANRLDAVIMNTVENTQEKD